MMMTTSLTSLAEDDREDKDDNDEDEDGEMLSWEKRTKSVTCHEINEMVQPTSESGSKKQFNYW